MLCPNHDQYNSEKVRAAHTVNAKNRMNFENTLFGGEQSGTERKGLRTPREQSLHFQIALFDMPNSNRFNILSISIFSKISLSISILIFSRISISI